jgi:hydrogenase-1 operon protein HyaF
MSRLKDIGIKVLTPEPPDRGGYAHAILAELQAMVERLLTLGQEDSIDLRGLPMGPGDYDRLKEILGQGEVAATVQAMGPTHIYETAYPGIWWVTHHNMDEEVVADLIEVTLQPQILKSHAEDIREGLERLQERLKELRGAHD